MACSVWRWMIPQLVILMGVATTGLAADDWPPGEYMTQAIAEMLATVRQVSDESNIGYDEAGICLVGVHLERGDSYGVRRPFQAGVRYIVIAGGDDDVRDVDLEILDDGRSLVKDDRDARGAWVELTPDASGSLEVRLELAAAKRGSFCTMAFLRRGGIDVPQSNLIAAGKGLIGRCSAVQDFARTKDATAFFLARPGQAAVFGSLLAGGENIQVNNVDLGSTPSVIVAAGDSHSRDLDLELISDGRTVAKDVDNDPLPVVAFTPDEDDSYSVKLINATNGGKLSLAMFGVLQLGEQR